MARYKHPARKKRLIRAGRCVKWAPLFAVIRKFGVGKKIHPSRLSRKRHWRRNTIKT